MTYTEEQYNAILAVCRSFQNDYDRAFERLKAQQQEIDELKTEIIKQDQAIIERNFELVDLEDKIKQAKIDVLNELKKRSYRDSVYFPEIKYQHKYVHMDDIDEMIEELKNAEDKG